MQAKSLEISMKLEASPIQDTNLGVQQIQSQLASLHMDLQSLKKGKVQNETRVDVWCLKYKGCGHSKYHFPVYQNYLIGGGHVPLKLENIVGTSTGVVPWCVICQITGKNMIDNCHLLQKFVQTP